jgi:hypothetical protein
VAAAARALLKAVQLQAAGVRLVRGVVEDAGGISDQLESIEKVTAYRGNKHELLAHQFFRGNRATMMSIATRLEFEATSADHSVLDALAHSVRHWGKTREFIPDHDENGVPVDVSFASVNWRRAIRDRKHPGMLVRPPLRGDGVLLPGRGAAHRRCRGGPRDGVRRLEPASAHLRGVRSAAGGVL